MSAFNRILLLGVVFAIVDLCAGSQGSPMDIHKLPTSLNVKPRRCSKSDPKVAFVNVNPCKKAPCILQPWQWYNLTVSFTTNAKVTGGLYQVDVRKRSTWVTIKVKNDVHLCNGLLGARCPLRAGESVLFKAPGLRYKSTGKAHKPKKYPIRFSMQDKRGNNIFCYQLTVLL